MAFGSAAPEIIVNAVSTVKSASKKIDPKTATSSPTDLGIGAILGSGMIAFMLIPGACAAASEDTLQLKRRPLLRDMGTYFLALVCLVIFFSDGVITLTESAVLVCIYITYIFVLIVAPKIRRAHRMKHGRPVKTGNFIDQQKSVAVLGGDGDGLQEVDNWCVPPTCPTPASRRRRHLAVASTVAVVAVTIAIATLIPRL